MRVCWRFIRPIKNAVGVLLFAALCFQTISIRAAEPEEPPVTADAKRAASAIRLPAQVKAVAVASEPNLANPTAMCFDPDGRIFVSEAYRVDNGAEDNRQHPEWLHEDIAALTVDDRVAYLRRHTPAADAANQPADRVRLLKDADGDGYYESSSVFSDGYNSIEDGIAAGVMWVNDGLLFACIPSLWKLQDADGDGRAEGRNAVATGFGVHTAFIGHDMHGLCMGPDGKVYFSIGDRGLNVVSGEKTIANPHSGAVLRCNPDGTRLELVATGLRNPQELAFNEFGDLFTVDNNSDNGDRARVVHIVEGMDAGWRMSYQYLEDRGPFFRERIWETQNDAQPASIIPPLAHLGNGPSGLAYYPGTGLDDENAGAFFLCEFRFAPATSGIRRFWLEQQGATYRLANSDFFAEGVLPTDCCFGPDGNFYLCDWVNGATGTGTGRIHRISSDDPKVARDASTTKKELQRIPSMTAEELLHLLANRDARVRSAAQQQLVQAGLDVAPRLLATANDASAPLLSRLHSIWAMGQFAETSEPLFLELLPLCDDKDPEVRAQAAKTLGYAEFSAEETRETLAKALTPLLDDESPRVQLLAALSIARLACPIEINGLLQLTRATCEQDPVLRHAAVSALFRTQTQDELIAAAHEASAPERLAIALALAKLRSPRLADFLSDSDPRVALAAARGIWDTPIPAAYEQLADAIVSDHIDNEAFARRALAANQALRAPRHLRATIDFALSKDLEPKLQEAAWKAIRTWAEPSPLDLVHGEWRPLDACPVDTVVAEFRSRWTEIAPHVDSNPTPAIIAAELGMSESYPTVLAIAAQAQNSASERSQAIRALANAPEAIAMSALERSLKDDDAGVRIAALRLLVGRFPERSLPQLTNVIESGSTAEQQIAIAALAELKSEEAADFLAEWMARVEQRTCPQPLVLDVLQAAEQSGNSALTARGQAFNEALLAAGPLEAYVPCFEGGDARRGGHVFETNAAAACRRCHSTEPGVHLVGPSLADVGQRLNRRELLEAIIQPNAKIVEGYQATQFLLMSGKIVNGIVRREDNDQVVVVDENAEEIVIPQDKIDDRWEGKSGMPEGLVQQMSKADLRDLIQFLSEQRTAGSPVEGHR